MIHQPAGPEIAPPPTRFDRSAFFRGPLGACAGPRAAAGSRPRYGFSRRAEAGDAAQPWPVRPIADRSERRLPRAIRRHHVRKIGGSRGKTGGSSRKTGREIAKFAMSNVERGSDCENQY
ncbi:Hypothetical protein NTJ_06176 [Nesidiocoris tenuis]|uniref:Uncharacterized protein n=1 Tax=Nesidiocoris tenuis TaxID=355587 RepID=A0ABN7ASK1_9HEMI|nr:Hypothetical protein NTJ_06176 [Nesidiocoris tenuis]